MTLRSFFLFHPSSSIRGWRRLLLIPFISLSFASGTASAQEPGTAPQEVRDPKMSSQELQIRLVPLTRPELEEAAAAWQELVRAETKEVLDAQLEVLRASGDQKKEAARERLQELVAQRKRLFDNFVLVIDALEQKAGDEALVREYRAYANSIVVGEARVTDFGTMLARLGSWLRDPEGGVAFGKRVGLALLVFLVLLSVARLARAAVAAWARRSRRLSNLLKGFLEVAVFWLVVSVGLMIVLSMIGLDIAPLFALVGGASFILAFAFQDSLGNLAAGLMIMLNRPFDEGDVVEVAGIGGTVRSVTMTATIIVTPDNQVIVVPNRKIWGEIITNVTASETRRIDLVFGIGYDDSIETARTVLRDVIAGHEGVLQEPEPVIEVAELADSSVNLTVRPWVKSEDYWQVRWDLTRQVKNAFDEADISIPFPQRDVNVYHAETPPAQG